MLLIDTQTATQMERDKQTNATENIISLVEIISHKTIISRGKKHKP